MANFTIYSNLNHWTYEDLWSLDFNNVTSPSVSPTRVSAFVDGIYVVMSGHFSYNAYGLTGGTLTGMTLSYGGASMLSATGLDLDVVDLAYSSPSAVERSMFAGSDTITSSWSGGAPYFTYGGDDRITLGSGDDTVDGGTGTDTFVLAAPFRPGDFSLSGNAVVIDTVQGRDTLSNIEIVEFQDNKIALQVGGAYDDRLSGDNQPGVFKDLIYGNGGDDWVGGGGGADRLFGNAGDDTMLGKKGTDTLLGGTGRDTLNGGAHADGLFGQRGNDVLKGGAGNDVLNGGGGRDELNGQKGNDVLTGGAGRDVFFFRKGNGDDRITDFEIGLDTIEIGVGASDLSDLSFARKGADVLVSFADVSILVEDVTRAELRDISNFDL